MQTLMIGLDGATWDVIKPLIQQGKLPNIRRLMGDSAYGTLLSIEGYTSPALWATIDTGKAPEKHRVLDFYGDFRDRVKATRLFDLLAGNTGRIGLYGWYSTYPPQPNLGFTIPSPMAPGAETFPERWRFVKELRSLHSPQDYLVAATRLLVNGARLSSLGAAFRAAVFRKALGPRHPTAYYKQLFAEAQINADAFIRLVQEHRPDFAAILFNHIDAVGHRYWKYMEPGAFADLDAGRVKQYRHVVPQAYLLADRLVGRIMKQIPPQTTVVVASDHGQMADPEGRKSCGYRPRSEVLKALGIYEDVYATILSWKMTLRLIEGRDKLILEKVGKLLEKTVIKESGLPLYEVWSPGDGTLRVGLKLDHIETTERTIGNASVLFGNGRAIDLREVVDVSSGQTYEYLSGAHAPNGIYIIRGERVQRGFEGPEANLVDIVPTLLALNHKPVGRDMDGQPIEEIFEDGFLRTYPVTFVDSHDIRDEQEQIDKALTDDERKELENRLRALGYL